MKELEPSQAGAIPEADARRLLHELEVHQIELEMQNEELRRARAETEAGLERYTELFDFAPIGYATLSSDGTIREVNHTGARLLERDRSALEDVAFASMLLEADRPAFIDAVKRALVSERTEGCDARAAQRDGGLLHLRLTATALGRQRLILLAFQDITVRKEREEALARAENALREADRRKNEFLAVLSHELRNPLASIRNSLFVLGKTQPGGEQSRRAVAVIDRQVTFLKRLVDDLLDVTRIAHGKIRLQPVQLEVGELLRRTIDDHRGSFEASGIRLESHLQSGSFRVKADLVRLVQIFSNLLGNAEKFTPPGGSVVVSLWCEGDRVSIRVRDSGVGIAPDVMKHVFEPFAQGPQPLDRTTGGLGLGLAMVKSLVELHSGMIALSSEGPGKGTEVTVWLPLDSGRESAVAPVPREPSRPRRVLVVEDNTDAADSLKEALSFFGHEVQVAYDGPSGLQMACESRPEIAICDIGLPGMDGYSLAKALRAEPSLRGIYLIALTGYAQPDDLQLAAEAGFDGHLAKPAALDEVARLLDHAPSRWIIPAGERAPASGMAPR